MKLIDRLLNKKVVNSNGYTRSDTGTEVHAYLRTHPQNQGLSKKITKGLINGIKKK